MSVFRSIRSLAVVALIAGVALGASARAASAASMWCPNGPAHGDGHTYENVFDAGWDYLCSGDYNHARQNLESVNSHFSEFGLQDPTLYTLQRGLIFAYMGTYGDKEARRALDRFETTVLPQYHESDADRAIERGHYADGFNQYIAQANLKPGADPTLEAAAASVGGGDLDTATKLLEADRVGALNTLLLGDVYAAQKRWNDAFAMWVAVASIPPHIQPDQNYAGDPNSFIALEMLTHFYRDHASGQ